MSQAIATSRAGRARPESRETLDLCEVIHLFRNHFLKILLCVTLGVIAAFFYLNHARPIYTSAALLEVSQAGNQNSAPTEIETSEMLKTVERKLASQSVLLAVIKNNRLQEDPEFLQDATVASVPETKPFQWITDLAGDLAARLGTRQPPTTTTAGEGTPARRASVSDAELVRRFSSKVGVHVMRGSRLIALNVDDRDPERTQHLAQAIVDEFFKQSREARSNDVSSTQQLLATEVKRAEATFRGAQEKLEAYRAKFNAVSLAERQNIVVERLRELNQQAAVAKNTRLAREAELAQVRRLENAPPEQLLVIRSIAESPDILELRKQVTAKEAVVATFAQRYGPLHPTMVQQRSELAELHGSYQNGIRKAAHRVREACEAAQSVERSLESALAGQEKAALELDRIAIPYNALEREAQANGEMYRKVLDELNKLNVARGLTSNNDINGIDIRIVEPPLVPVQPARPRRGLLLAISAAAGLFLGCGLALGARALDTSVTSVDAAEATLGLPVLATVPRTRHHRLSYRAVVLRFPASASAEAFRSLRTALALSGEEEARCILFTSAVPGEGKTFCSLNTAAAYAQQGMRTLLIDADLRRPSLLKLFAEPGHGATLADCMRDPALFPQAVQRTPIENLFVLGNWAHEPGAAEAVARDGLRPVLERAAGSFNRVIIDSAPLMAVSDTLHLAQHVPTICLVVYAGKTPRRVAQRALKLLEDVAKRAATGLVLNKIKNPTSADYYYYYNA